jgi:superfamily I DNA/RNA helicase
MFTASKYQSAIFSFVTDHTGNAVVEAVAGSGKTTTIVQAVNLIPNNKSILMLAFNKNICEELNSRINLPHCQVKTFHSLGYSAYRQVHGVVKMDDKKIYRLIDDLVWNSNLTDEERAGIQYVAKIVKLGKSAGIATHILDNTPENWLNLMDHHDIGGFDDVDLAPVVPICMEILRRSNNMTKLIDFDDMIYLPVQQGIKFQKFDWILCDESQDCSATQREILKAIMKPASRMIAVGDPFQAIYGFRGADSTSMASIKSEFNAVSLPLSISYRCPRSVVAEARKYVSHIEASDTAIEGTVTKLDKYTEKDFSPTDVIMCRNVAPLVRFAYGLIAHNIPVNMLGRDIGSGLVKLIKSFKASSIQDLETKLGQWKDREMMKLSSGSNNEAKLNSVTDKFDCIEIFLDQATVGMTVNDLAERISNFFSEEPNGNITLATIHKVKGREYDKAIILDPHRLMPKWAKKPWMVAQETNICYVAVTRAKKELVFLDSDSWSEKAAA